MPQILRMHQSIIPWLDTVENRNLVSETLVVKLTHGGFALDFRPRKRALWQSPSPEFYARPTAEALLDDRCGAAYFALEEGTLIGQIVLAPQAYRLTKICDVRVTPLHRKRGVGRQLVEAAERWAWQQGSVGLSFETQDDNPTACQFILRCGFRIGGVDLLRYKGLPGRIGTVDALCESALSFYRLFT